MKVTTGIKSLKSNETLIYLRFNRYFYLDKSYNLYLTSEWRQ